MANMIKTSSYSTEKDILLAPHLAFTIAVQVNNTGVATENGKKIIPAGTPVGGTTSVLETRSTVLSVTNKAADGANAQGVLRHDVDVTDGTANAELIIGGYVDSSKCPTIDTTAKTALTRIVFVNGGAY